MLQFALYGAQAAGLVADIWTSSLSHKTARRGVELEEAQLDLRLKQEVLASNEQSLFNLEQLAETLATQRAFMAVRGGLPGVGSSLAQEQRAVTGFNKDEEARKLSLGFSAAQTKAQIGTQRIALAAQRGKQGAQMFGKAFNMIPFGEMAETFKGEKIRKNARTAGIPNKKVGLLSPERGFNG